MRKRTNQIIIRLTDDELAALNEQVKRTNLSREQYCRDALKGVSIREKPPVDLPKLILEDLRVGNNINQLATIANAQGLLDAPQLREEVLVLREFEKLIVSPYTNH